MNKWVLSMLVLSIGAVTASSPGGSMMTQSHGASEGPAPARAASRPRTDDAAGNELRFDLQCSVRDEVRADPEERLRSGFGPDGTYERERRLVIDLKTMRYCIASLCREYGLMPIAALSSDAIFLQDDRHGDPRYLTVIHRRDLEYSSRLSSEDGSLIVSTGRCARERFSGFGGAKFASPSP